ADSKSDKLQPYAGGGGGGISLSPMGCLVFYDNQPTLVKVDEKSSEGKWKDLISATINLVKDKK
ncbi:MAG: sporulation protein YtfJ, partial [Clostridia bacterium]|nr:sporulation protein YtfJ [Clostridia bacterium]